jgi:hypothetical protein
MATWKERGEVPDSDDDEDIESQSLENGRDGGQPGDGTASEHGDEEAGINYDNEELRDSQDAREGHQNWIQQGNEIIREASPSRDFTDNAEDLPTSVLSSPIDHVFFQIPDLEGVLEEEVDQIQVASRSQCGSPLEDDISTSYVRITSQASSRRLTPTGSLPELPSLRAFQHGSRMSTPDPTESLPELPSLRVPQHGSRVSPPALRYDEPSPTLQAVESPVQQPDTDGRTSYPMRRTLRHRNPIQLHPYVVENEKYRRTLKARGIAPMRLDSSQAEPQHAPRRSLTPDPDFQQEDTPDIGRNVDESQAMDFDYTAPSSSPERPSGTRGDGQIAARNDILEKEPASDSNDEDDEFPDIDELLRSRPDTSVKQIPKKVQKRSRLKSYSHKFKRPVLPRIMTQSSKSKQPTRHDQVMLDLPASPPKTSSPHVNLPSRRTDTSNGDMRSLEPSPSWLSQDEVSLRRTADLPTPSTSALKPPNPPNPISLDSDSDDPFASDVVSDVEGSVSSTSSDESVQIRKITKKFRGVLPASHLRLDQNKRQQAPRRTNRDSHSVSPVKNMPRRGVALPRTQSGTINDQGSPSATTGAAFPVFSDESDEDEPSGFIMEDDDNATHLESLFDRSHMGLAEEEDRVDAMLPSRKRPSTTSNRPKKKRKLASSSLQQTESNVYKRQPKITEHLDKAPRTVADGRSRKSKKRKREHAPRMPTPPAIGLLDVADMLGSQTTQPDFVRIAARAARSSKMQGRHQPTGKFFRLATREDTEDVQAVLKDWSSGKFRPRQLPSLQERIQRMPRQPLSRIQSNQNQSYLAPPSMTAKPAREFSQAIRRLPVNRRQQSMNDFVRREESPPAPQRSVAKHHSQLTYKRSTQKRPRVANQSARPAQLEALEVEYAKQYPTTTFKSSKRALDALYRKTRKRPVPSVNLQLTRFLADEHIVLSSIEEDPALHNAASEEFINSPEPQPQPLPLVRGRQKPLPRRVDVGAAVYRQPSEPLILNYLTPLVSKEGGSESKLRGLAKFREKYPQNFDILPLPPGVFFHAETFIGSGQLFQFTSQLPINYHANATPVIVSLDRAKIFSWDVWNENVSSEIGLCFDWLVDQLALEDPESTFTQGSSTMDVIRSLCNYMQQRLTFDGPLTDTMFLSRMLEVLKDFSSRLQVHDLIQDSKIQVGIQVLSRVCAMTVRLLSLARAKQQCSGLVFDLENVLKAIASQCARLLLSRDMSLLRKLYDDLQYLSYRDNGIRNDQYIAEGWVVLIKVLSVAKISRGSFWDVVNPWLTDVKIVAIMDAPTMERIWYNMFTLLPLCEFDEHGVVIQDDRHHASFDNWQVPQQLLKRVFNLYTCNPRQSPGFNDYCRALLGRCHCLMVEWGWWNSSGLIGTIFDFFATHNLAHLRNEEVYTSPLFLAQLDQNPSLTVEAEDCCFHIFLKLVALALKQFSSSNNLKSAGNLVARLQPNHNRQYPKEETIQQKDLASLRNHHDILCTLFWAAPPEQRPSVETIQRVVEPEGSHAEAVTVHSQARRSIANYLYSTTADAKTMEPVVNWLEKDLRTYFTEYEAVEGQVRQEATEAATEEEVQDIVTKNRKKILALIIEVLNNWRNDIDKAKSMANTIQAFNAGKFQFRNLSFSS